MSALLPCLALVLGLLDASPAPSPPSASALRRAAEAGGRAWVRVQATASGPGVLVGADGQVLTVESLLRGDSALVQVAGTRRPDWPRRVQEADSPHFEVAHLDELRPGTPVRIAGGDDELASDEPQPELLDLGSRPIDDR